MATRGILLELRVPRGLDTESILRMARDEIQVSSFRVDPAYEPVAVPPSSERQSRLTFEEEATVLVRGTIEEGDEDALEREPTVVAIWSDPRIEAFGEDPSGSDLAY